MPYTNDATGIALMESHVAIVISHISPFGVWAINTVERILSASNPDIGTKQVLYHMSDFGWIVFRYDIGVALPENPRSEVLSFQLTEEGRILKALGSVQSYHSYIRDKMEKEVRRQQLSDALLESNLIDKFIQKRIYYSQVSIALATTVAALYYMAELFDFYERHFLNKIRAFYFGSGILIGLLLGILAYRGIYPRKSKEQQPPALP